MNTEVSPALLAVAYYYGSDDHPACWLYDETQARELEAIDPNRVIWCVGGRWGAK